ncbi:class I SAM-dependent RNA methyltransferase [Trueperella sp. LYQ143]|uniref:class I SAM-dependent RNA methyltransferase n=1 Tax=unclassified Trueperella TaxID=2630174 RepID=UPI00398307DA
MRVTVGDIGHGGVCVARLAADEETMGTQGRVMFVRGAIPGEDVEVQVTKKKRAYWEANVVDVYTPSPHRRIPFWAQGAVGVTGAADFSHIEISYQRQLKSQVIDHVIDRIGGARLREQIGSSGVPVLAVDDGDGWHTRTRIDLTKCPTGMGMTLERSHDVTPIAHMPMADSRLDSLDLFGAAWDTDIPTKMRVRAVQPALGDPVLCVGDEVFSAPGKRAHTHITEAVHTRYGDVTYRVHARNFWQVHHHAPEALMEAVLAPAGIEPEMNVVELYSGSGLFSVPIAVRLGERGVLHTYEGAEQAVTDARENLRAYPWAQAHCQRLEVGLSDLVADAEVVIADPSRSGLGVGIAGELARCPAEHVVLVSCDPASMARDVAELLSCGRYLESIVAYDIFPHTHHVEIVSVLRRLR